MEPHSFLKVSDVSAEKCTFLQNVHTKKLGEKTFFFAVVVLIKVQKKSLENSCYTVLSSCRSVKKGLHHVCLFENYPKSARQLFLRKMLIGCIKSTFNFTERPTKRKRTYGSKFHTVT